MTTIHLPSGIVIDPARVTPSTITATQPEPQRDEHLIGQLQRVDDFCRRGDVDPGPVMPAIERVVKQIGPLKEAASGLNQRQRRVLSDAIGRAVREGLE